MKIAYETIEAVSIFIWLSSFLTSCYIAIKIPALGFLPIIILLGGFLVLLFFGSYVVEKGYEFVWEDIEISRRGIDRKK